MRQAVNQINQPRLENPGLQLSKPCRAAHPFVHLMAMVIVLACFPLIAFGQEESNRAEVEIELENFEQPKAEEDEDVSWFGTIMTFPAEPEPFRLSSHAGRSEIKTREIFIEGKVEPEMPMANQVQSNRSAVAKDSHTAVKLTMTNSSALVDGTDFMIEIENISGERQGMTSVSLQVPESMTLVSASRAPKVDQANRLVMFPVKELASGSRDTITYRVRTTIAGSQKQTVSISPENRPRFQVELNTSFESR